MRVISWNLLRLEGAAVHDVAALLERERPDVLLMQEVTQHMDVLLHKVPGHYHRLPWPGRIHGLAVWSRHNFATPHILPHRYDNTLAGIREAAGRFRAELDES